MEGFLAILSLNNDLFDFSFVDGTAITKAIFVVLAGLTFGFVLMFFGGVRFTDTKLFRKIARTEVQDASDGYTSNFKKESYLGRQGTAYTVLRPSGKILIDDQVYDAYTRGGFIEKGMKIEVIDEEGTSLMVKQIS